MLKIQDIVVKNKKRTRYGKKDKNAEKRRKIKEK